MALNEFYREDLDSTVVDVDVDSGDGAGVKIIPIARNRADIQTLLNFGSASWVQGGVAIGAKTGTPTTPTCIVLLQSSMDKTNWDTVITFTTATTSATTERKSANRFSSTPALLGLFWRWKITVATVSGNTTYAVTGTILLGKR